MSDVKQARTLVGAATRDLLAIRGMSDPEVFADEIFGFHVQQAAEKLFTEYNPFAGWMRYDDRVISTAQSIDRKDALRRIEEFHQQVLNQLPEVANP